MDLEISESTEKEKISDPTGSETKLNSENSIPKPPHFPRLQALPPDLKKVSAGSISLNTSEAPQATSTVTAPPMVSAANSTEDMISESRRILASLATFEEVEKNEAERIEVLKPVEEKPFSKRAFGNLEQARRALVRWLGEGGDIPLIDLPKSLLKYSEIQGAAIIDQEGLILALESKLKLNYKVLANLTLRLFSQSRFAAEELETSFQDQVVVGFETMALQISYHRGFYLIAFFEQLPSSNILRRLRKVIKALARVEAGG